MRINPSITDFLLGTDPRLRLRLRRSMLATVVYLACLLAQWESVELGLADGRDATRITLFCATGLVLFLFAIRSGLSTRFGDAALTMPQMVFALVALAVSYHVNPTFRAGLVLVAPLVLVFGAFILPARRCVHLGWFTLAVFGATIAYGAWLQPERFPPLVEAHTFGFVAVVVPTIAYLAGQLSQLRIDQKAQKIALRAAMERLSRIATHDELTGLPNRSQLRTLIDQALDAGQGDGTVAVACCNLVRFKTVNDAYGHSVGDQILRLVGQRLREITRPCDRVGRFGSDEFVLICDDPTGADSVEQLIDRIHSVFAEPVVAHTVSVKVSGSVGVVLATQNDTGVDADGLLRDAVTAMHDAKARGTATGRFHQELRAAVVYRADIEQRLVGAVTRGEIAVFYQPVVDLGTGTIAGFEALARWQRDGRHIPPAEWIPIAETTDLIHEIGEHVLLTAAAQAACWRAAGHPVSMSVNVSARQMASIRIEDSVRRALELLPADALVIEVTESLALDASAQRALQWLRTLGVRTALDDFGTGFSSLAAAARLPIDSIKIDQSITKRATYPDGNALVGATVAIARALGLTVVAEGIESVEQQQATSELGCQYGQGFLFSQPVRAEDATEQLRSLSVSPFIVQRQAH